MFIEAEPDGIVKLTSKPVPETLETTREVVDAVREIRERWGHKVLLLADARAVPSASKASRRLYASPAHQDNLLGLAILVDSGISRVIGNFYIAVDKPSVPTRLFSDIERAREWLEGLKG